MILKRNKAVQMCGQEDTTDTEHTGKFHVFLMKIGKRNVIIAAAVLLIGAAVALNFVLFSKSALPVDGYPGYDDTQPSGADLTPTDTPEPDSVATFFSATQVNRQRARDEALEVLQSVAENLDADEGVRAEALSGINGIADEIRKEADMESLITAKGFEQCVAVLNGDKVNIIVRADSLLPAQIAQINEVVYSQTGIAPSGVTIINK